MRLNEITKSSVPFLLLLALSGCGEKESTQSAKTTEISVALADTPPTLPVDYTTSINENAIVGTKDVIAIIDNYSSNIVEPFLSKQPSETLKQGEFEKSDEFEKRVLEQANLRKFSIDLPSDWEKTFAIQIPATFSYDPDKESYTAKLGCTFKPFQNILTEIAVNEIFCLSDKKEITKKDGVITYKRQINYGPTLINLSQDLLPIPGTLTFNFDYAIDRAKALGNSDKLNIIAIVTIDPNTILDDSKNQVDVKNFFGSFSDDGKGGVSSHLPDKYETISVNTIKLLVINKESREIIYQKETTAQSFNERLPEQNISNQ